MVKLSFFVKNNILLLVLVFLINGLFVIKYSVRLNYVPQSVICLFYAILFVGSLFLYKRLKFFSNNFRKVDNILMVFILVIFFILIFINIKVDGLTLNVDRFSALEVLISSVLSGEYPYSVLDHLDNTTSNLPGLFYLSLPFYLLGDVGFLQPFTFLFFSLVIIYSKIKNEEKIFIIALLLTSPSFFWEVIAKSDLMSNCILILIFISLWHQKFKTDYFKNIKLLAFLVALFTLTRGIVAIPITIFLFSSFCNISMKRKIAFILYLILFSLLISLPILITLPDYNFILEHNPFNHQTRYAPTLLIIISLILPFILSFKVKKSSDIFLYTTYILAGLMLITFSLNCFEEGFGENLYGNLFDISYLSMIIPFIIFYFFETFKNRRDKLLENY